MALTLGSLFDGSGGFPLAGILAGIQPVWASEIEPFAIRVTEKRLPDVQHFGDINTLNGAELPPVDIITFGSPCQDMSIAGKRSGLDGSRSSLFHEAIRIIREMRCAAHGEKPRFIVWENVCGAFSSNAGEDFRTVLEEICKVKDSSVSVPQPEKWTKAGEIVADNFSVAWRVLNACGWGVPQRRKRIYLVADFDGQCAGKILFESEGVSGYSAESFRAWQGTAGFAEEGTGTAGGNFCVLNDQGGNRMDVTDNISGTLRAEAHGHPPCVLESHPTAFGICSKDSNSMKSDNPHSGFYEADTSRTIDTSDQSPAKNQGGMAVVAIQGSMIGRSPKNGPQGNGANEDISFTLNCTDKHAVVYSTSKSSHHTVAEINKTNTLVATDYKDPPLVTSESHSFCPQMKAESQCWYVVRRLVPQECARLQGFPDWWCSGLESENPDDAEIDRWTEIFETFRRAVGSSAKPKSRNAVIKWLKNPHSDSAEYKMWGNGIALPCAYFVLAGIAWAVNELSHDFQQTGKALMPV